MAEEGTNLRAIQSNQCPTLSLFLGTKSSSVLTSVELKVFVVV